MPGESHLDSFAVIGERHQRRGYVGLGLHKRSGSGGDGGENKKKNKQDS